MKKIILFILIAFVIISCEDIIFPELITNDPIIVVDAWINDKNEKQTIFLSTTQDYLDSSSVELITGANIIVEDDNGNIFEFIEETDGNYVWHPNSQDTIIGIVGTNYNLKIEYENKIIEASSTMNRTSTIDSINFVEGEFPDVGSYYAEFWSQENIGLGDAYWIKAWKNGELLASSKEIIACIDAGATSMGIEVDGGTFIPPIRRSITQFEKDDNDDFLSPFKFEDSLYVEIHSITLEAFYFLYMAKIQINRRGGFSELFSVSLANLPTNIFIANNTNIPILGFFCVSSVSGKGNILDEDELNRIEKAKRKW
tara:strand:+ start:794 stop:1732 length:939 start_codon:yes stop_codon:yes gene_type:complete